MGTSHDVLLASGLGHGGGLFRKDREGWRRIDHLSCTGLAMSSDRQQLARVLWTSDDPQARAELLISDRIGIRRYLRVDALKEPHGLLYDRNELVAVSTLENRLLWLDAAGDVVRERVFAGRGDAWHLNCPAWADGRLVVTAFGRYDMHRDWARAGLSGTGVILDVERGDTLASGLSAPHDPTPIPGGWLVCDSATSRLLRLDEAGAVAGAIDVGGWARGLALDGGFVHVGVSARRDISGGPSQAHVVTARLEDLTIVDRTPLPCDEVFALLHVSEELVAGAEVGFALNPARDTALAGSGSALACPPTPPSQAPQLQVTGVCPHAVEPGRFFDVAVTLSGANETLYASGPASWRVGARWLLHDGTTRDDGPRAGLAAPLLPGRSEPILLRVRAPEDLLGQQRLELRLVCGEVWHPTASTQLAVTLSTTAA